MRKDKYILIVGGAGYIGSHVNKLLNMKGYKTVVFDNLVYGHREFVKWGEFILGDLANKEQIRLCFKNYNIDAVMHFSAYAYVGESVTNPSKYYNNNVACTLNLLDTMLEFGVNHFIFSSSCATYGLLIELPINENHPQNHINPYGKSKFMVEQILKDYDNAYSLKFVSLRYFNVAGADPDVEIGEWHEPETHLIPLILDVAKGKSENVTIYGNDYDTPDGTCIRDYIHVCYLAEAHILSLHYLETFNQSEIFNLGNEKGYSVKEVIKTAELVTGKKININIGKRRPGDPPILIADSNKIRNTLGWYPNFTDLSNIIETAWKWHKKIKS